MKTQTVNRDPFSRIPIPKSFYHPSQQKKLSKTAKKVALSPSKDRCVSPEDELFLKGSNVFSSRTPPTRDNYIPPTKFDESWPTSERPSLTSVSGYSNSNDDRDRLPDHKESVFKNSSQTNENNKTGSILQRYVNRFRNSAPMSREERIKKDGGSEKEFWWLSSSPLTPTSSSTPKDEDDSQRRSRQFIDRTESKAYRDTFKSMANARQQSSLKYHIDEDLESQRLQEKADRILGMSESSVGSYEAEPAISSEGLNSSVPHTSSSFEEAHHRSTYRRDSKHREPPAKPFGSRDLPDHVSSLKRPEEDILYQWRLQRKMDLSRLGAADMIAKNNSEVQSKLKEIQQKVLTKELSAPINRTPGASFNFTPNPNILLPNNTEVPSKPSVPIQPEPVAGPSGYQTSFHQPNIASPTLPRKYTSNQESVEPHLHLMCDVLPCPHAQKYQQQFEHVYIDSKEESNYDSEQETPHDCNDSTHYKQFLEAEKPHTDKKDKRKNARVTSKVAQTQTKADFKDIAEFKTTEIENFVRKQNVTFTDSVEESLNFAREETWSKNIHEIQDGYEDNSRTHQIHEEMPSNTSKSQSIRPKYSSSPARSKAPIHSAIGQAVKDYMFTASSSIDSISSLLSPIPERQTDEDKDDVSYKDDDENAAEKEYVEEEYTSDGEYSEDQLLMLLRQQRDDLEKKLGEIDKLI